MQIWWNKEKYIFIEFTYKTNENKLILDWIFFCIYDPSSIMNFAQKDEL